MKGPLINGEQYELVVLRVLSYDQWGRPGSATVMYDDSPPARLDDSSKPNEFLTAFVKASLLAKKAGH